MSYDMPSNQTDVRLCLQDLLTFPFPYKLWIVVHVDDCDFLRWNADGTCIVIDLPVLETYLNSMRTIFHIRSNAMFFEVLESYGFERYIPRKDAAGTSEFSVIYYHKDFKRWRLDLVANLRSITRIKPVTFKRQWWLGHKYTDPDTTTAEVFHDIRCSRMQKDLCFTSYGGLSAVVKQRLYAKLVVGFERQSQILSAKLEQVQPMEHRSRRKNDAPIINAVICKTEADSFDAGGNDTPKALGAYENPLASSFMNSSSNEYAGYYGNATTDQLLNFFGNYLPSHGQNGTVVVMEHSDMGADEECSDMEEIYMDDTNNPPSDFAYTFNPNAGETIASSTLLANPPMNTAGNTTNVQAMDTIMHSDAGTAPPPATENTELQSATTKEEEDDFYAKLRSSWSVLNDIYNN